MAERIAGQIVKPVPKYYSPLTSVVKSYESQVPEREECRAKYRKFHKSQVAEREGMPRKVPYEKAEFHGRMADDFFLSFPPSIATLAFADCGSTSSLGKRIQALLVLSDLVETIIVVHTGVGAGFGRAASAGFDQGWAALVWVCEGERAITRGLEGGEIFRVEKGSKRRCFVSK
ncbi:hypothetical protein FNV43_RR03302 [Rhamnella rubrinervis]|uniref:Uncharacterized protein n=1 Tax=Rhamnella rubrinervis TaxID=2594499 RepID=A0A8K0MNY4_9ROSA|nr:hypothetical protein FNV43_RR03302 [Rhamnella rubrinervis]